MSDDDLQPLITAAYLGLADLLDDLPADGWDQQSLCEDWRIREVVAHVTMPSRYSVEEFMNELSNDEFDFTRLSNRIASRDANLPTGDLVRNLRDAELHGWTPPGGGQTGALNHVVIHSLDISVPLGKERIVSDAAACSVLDDLTEGGTHAQFNTDISGRTLQATDIEWSYGSGPTLAGPAAFLMLHICGRVTPPDQIDGDPLPKLR